MSLSSRKKLIRQLFLEGIAAVKPAKLVDDVLKVDNGNVIVNSRSYDLSEGKCYVVGFGKAVLGMAVQAEKILQNKLCRGVVSLPQGLQIPASSRLDVFHGAPGNIPDQESVRATEEIVRLVQGANERDLVLVFISGGGSALLAKPKTGVTLAEKVNLIKRLASSGADIKELNCVRKSISDIKGGKLCREMYPAQSVSFILSDIVGDPLDLISSGPTVKNTDSTNRPVEILDKYHCRVSQNVIDAIEREVQLEDRIFEKSVNILLGNNSVSLEAIRMKAVEEGYSTVILSNQIEENVKHLSEIYAILVRSVMHADMDQISVMLNKLKITSDKISEVKRTVSQGQKKICLLAGGETVVSVRGTGKGGRNQELALRFSTHFNEIPWENCGESTVVFLSGGTDGIDGPTDAAGAISYPGQAARAISLGLHPDQYLVNNDSYNYYNKLDNSSDLIKIGHTGVNVMDVHILLMDMKS